MLIRKLAGAPSGYGSYAFTSIMLRRDWHFRRQALPLMLIYLIGAVGLTVSGIRTSPFVYGTFSIRSFPPMLLLPVFLSLVCLMPCAMLRFTAEARGAWVYTILPFDRLRPFVRGMFLSLWIPIVGATHLCLLIPCIWFWGSVYGLLFVIFSSALTTLLLALTFLLAGALPFSESFAPGKVEDARMGMILGPVLSVIIAGVQWLVFQSVALVVVETALLLVLAVLLTHAGFLKLENEIRTQLKLFQLGPQHLFKEVDLPV